MPSVLEHLGSSAHVAVIRLRSLGDCVLTTPALEILKASRPDLKIGVAVEDRFAAVFEGNPDVDAILPPAVKRIRAWNPELTLNLHGGTRSMVLTATSGARLRAGFAHHKGASLYNVRIPRAQEILGDERIVHTAEHLASAMFYLGAQKRAIPRARLFAPETPSPHAYAVIHPLAATPEKTWPTQRFLSVAQQLRADGLEPVFIGGPGEDLTVFARYRCVSAAPLTEIKSLLASATLFVGNDSGPAHMAAAFGLPVVVLFGPSNPVVWAPWRTESHVLSAPDGIETITVREVVEAIERLRVTQ